MCPEIRNSWYCSELEMANIWARSEQFAHQYSLTGGERVGANVLTEPECYFASNDCLEIELFSEAGLFSMPKLASVLDQRFVTFPGQECRTRMLFSLQLGLGAGALLGLALLGKHDAKEASGLMTALVGTAAASSKKRKPRKEKGEGNKRQKTDNKAGSKQAGVMALTTEDISLLENLQGQEESDFKNLDWEGLNKERFMELVDIHGLKGPLNQKGGLPDLLKSLVAKAPKASAKGKSLTTSKQAPKAIAKGAGKGKTPKSQADDEDDENEDEEEEEEDDEEEEQTTTGREEEATEDEEDEEDDEEDEED
eukprot:g23393.t1